MSTADHDLGGSYMPNVVPAPYPGMWEQGYMDTNVWLGSEFTTNLEESAHALFAKVAATGAGVYSRDMNYGTLVVNTTDSSV